MRSSVAVVHELVSQLQPVDETEAAHRSQVLWWLSRTDDVFRRVKPTVPPQHLVSYVVPVDAADGSILLVDHVNAGLWLPPGGHVEVDEHPARTAQREAHEELGLTAADPELDQRPMFLTVTETVGMDAGHTDVSLWFVLDGRREQALSPDHGEFHRVRWWAPAELRAADPSRFDPHLLRFLDKLERSPGSSEFS
ncbi:NUDIX domain-containing protein [Phytohabitans rumicis]|uniref:DNA mismatch repair protein MutT n=1 Tax=Phytohabitans rumicis TaxID=1076125 RepID=A0A6V8LH57_9ACTN|nr:NUDIX domain-containing protein [Phytohabitans rumicis]GFJ93929.1 DNA mismatch repair protein MutT [Phytohabitans rumicis]